MTFRNRTIFISGASRGIGLAIARRLARDGANIILAAKTAEPHPKLPGTVFSAAKDVVAVGGKALPVVCDIRDEAQVQAAVDQGVAAFGGIDVCINNASAISLTGTLATDMKRYDLMNQVNARGTFLCSKLTLPHLLRASNPHILNLAPPLDLDPKWFAHHVAYTMAKFGMSLCTLGMAAEFRGKVAVNSLWPITAIDTAAVRFALGGDAMAAECRTPDILVGMRIAIGFGWTTLVAAEMVAASVGLGQMVLNASNFLRTDIVVMGIVVIGVVAYLFDLLMRWVERALVPWKGRM